MQTHSWQELLGEQFAAGKFVCVGLDPDMEKIPQVAQAGNVRSTFLRFNMQIIEATAGVAGAFKLNVAFYEAHGQDGISALSETIRYIRSIAPETPVILDAKRADIGNTNRGYAQAAFDDFRADAVTVNPLFGGEALSPFLDRAGKGIIVLCRTSNPGAKEFQGRIVHISDEEAERWGLERKTTLPLYQLVAWRVSREWYKNGNCALVVGATCPEELAEVRKIVGDGFPILIPGIGKQGGDLAAAVRAGKDGRSQGMVINSSSAIIFASKGQDFAEAAGREARKLHEAIQQHLKEG